MKSGLKSFWGLGFFMIALIFSFNLLSCSNGNSTSPLPSNNSAGGGGPAIKALSFSFADGNGLNGINKDSNQSANFPQLTVFNSKLYATWAEFSNNGSSISQIRVAVFNGNDSSPVWAFVDGNGQSGINKDVSKNANRPQLTVFGNNLYAIWQEFNGTAEQIRVAMYDALNLSWTFVDDNGGNGVNGINFDVTKTADLPHLTVFNSKLYATWEEFNGNSLQVRVKVFQGSGSWSSVDGNGIMGGSPQLVTDSSGSKLYLTWQEFNGTGTQVRMSVYNGKDNYPSWLSVDGVVKIPNGTVSCSPAINCPVFSSGGISGPAGVVTDTSGNVWVANSNNNSVTKISSSALTDCSSGCSTFINGGISGPAGVVTDTSGNVWVANSNNNSVTKIPNGAVDCSACVNFTGGGISGPAGIVTDSTGFVWVSNNNNSVTKISIGAALNCSPGCTNFTFVGISGPGGIATDSTGNIWVANSSNNSVTKIPNGAVDCSACVNFTGGGISGPAGIATDFSGNVWIANKVNYTVTKIPNGAVDCSGCLNFTGGGISGPAGIVTDSTGNVWVSNNNNSVTKISIGAALNCSLGCTKYTGGGTSQSGITLDGSGNVWISTRGSIGYNGMNSNPLKNANFPQLTVFGSKLYATWEESNNSSTQIRMAVYNGNDISPSWTFIDGNGVNGLNYDSSKFAHYPQLTVFGSNLYAAWQEFNGIATQIRLAMYNGNDSSPFWSFVDGNGMFGVNFNSGKSADHPQLTIFNSKLYASWDEYNIASQIRAAVGQ